jgi:hypothetical protein
MSRLRSGDDPHDDFESNQAKVMNVILSDSLPQHAGGKWDRLFVIHSSAPYGKDRSGTTIRRFGASACGFSN